VQALETHADFLDEWTNRPPQTNEVRRSAAIILAVHWLAGVYDLPLMTSELGASAGLNMNFDRFALDANGVRLGAKDPAAVFTPDWAGTPPEAHPFEIADRAGVDLNPVNAHEKADALRLLAYLWPDQPERITLTRAAIAAQHSTVEQGDAIEWLDHRLKAQKQGQLHLIYHTIAWQYFPPATQAKGSDMIQAAGSKATEDAPLAWLSLENDGGGNGAPLVLRIWPQNHTVLLGRACFHGRWIDWHPKVT